MTQTALDRDLIDRLDTQNWRGVQSTMFRLTKDQADKLRAALTASAEPVGWRFRRVSSNDEWAYSNSVPHFNKPNRWHVEPLFTSPQTPSPDHIADAGKMVTKLPNREEIARAICAGDQGGPMGYFADGSPMRSGGQWEAYSNEDGSLSQAQRQWFDAADAVLALFSATPDPDTVPVRREDLEDCIESVAGWIMYHEQSADSHAPQECARLNRLKLRLSQALQVKE